MSKQTKVMDVHDGACHLEVIRINDRYEYNPYRIIRVAVGHRNQIAKYGDWMSVIYFMRDFYRDGMDVCTLSEIKEWWKRGFGE